MSSVGRGALARSAAPLASLLLVAAILAGAGPAQAQSSDGWDLTNPAYLTDNASGQLGRSVALSDNGEVAIVGAPFASDGSGTYDGAAYLYVESDGTWPAQPTQGFSGLAGSGEQLGWSVALSADGTEALVGAPSAAGGAGAAYLYTESGGTWTKTATFTGSPGEEALGLSVALSADGRTALVGAPYAGLTTSGTGSADGAAFLYTESNGTWSSQAAQSFSGTAGSGELLGWSVALSADGSEALVGAMNASGGAGAAFVYGEGQQGAWALSPGGSFAGNADEEFGWSVALSADGTEALVGAPGSSGGSGSANFYTYNNGTWSSSPQSFSGSSDAAFGQSVALSADGTEALVGAPDPSEGAGSAYLYTDTAGTWSSAPASFAGSSTERLGWSVALSADGGEALVGAPAFASNDGGEANLYTKGIVTVDVSGYETYGSDVAFTYTDNAPSGVDVTGTLVCSSVNGGTAIAPTLAAGTYTVDDWGCQGLSLTGADAADYTISYAGVSDGFVVDPAPLTVTASDASMTYGGAVPTITASYSGFVNGDSAASLATAPTCTTTATSSSAPGTYATTCSGAVDANYDISYQAGTVTAEPAPLVVTASSATVTEGSAVPTVTPSYSGFVNGDSAASLAKAPTCTTTATSSSAPGTYATTCSGAVDANYDISYQAGTVTVEPPAPTAPTFTSPGSITATIGTPFSFAVTTTGSPVPTVTEQGALPAGVKFTTNGPGSTTLAGTPADGDIGTYNVKFTATNSGGSTTQSLQMAVEPAALTATASDASMTYGGAVPTVTPSYSGLVNGDSAASLTTPPACTTTATSSSAPGTYPTTCSGAVDANYDISYQTGTVTVEPAPLVVTASSATLTEGSAVPTVTPSYSGLVNGDSAASLTTPPACTTTATSSSAPGTYPTTCSGAVDANYDISYQAGTVTVTAAPVVTGPLPVFPAPASSPPPATTTTSPPTTTTSPTGTVPPVTKAAHSPELASLSPATGPDKVGTRVVIRGSSFKDVEAVRFGPRRASFKVVSPKEIIARSPAGTGTVAVRVTTPAGTSAVTKYDRFTYFGTSQVLRLSPATGPDKVGTRVVIRGSSFKDVEAVRFGPRRASFKVVSPKEIIARSPAGTGTVAVRVTTPAGTSAVTKYDRFTYKAVK